MATASKVSPIDTRPLGGAQSWARTHGTYIAGRAYMDEADYTACQMETKWGADRLRLLVTPELREKFDRQRYLFNQAIWHGDLEAVRREAQRMVRAWLALDQAATAAGKAGLSPVVWEVAMDDGTVIAIIQGEANIVDVATQREERRMVVYTLDEIARFLAAYPDVARAKAKFTGAEVTKVAKRVEDPLDAIGDSDEPLDDPLDDIGRH